MKHAMKKEQSIPREKKILFWLLLGLALLTFIALPMAMHAQEQSNTFYAGQFKGADATTKVNNAIASCNSTFTCVIVVDAALGVFPQGVGFVPCSQCVIMDYRTTGVLKIITAFPGSSTVNINGVTFANGAVLGNLGSSQVPSNSLVLGDVNGSLTANGIGAFTALRTLNLPDANSGTVIVGSLTTSAATSDTPTILGIKSGSHCQLQATNASAATNIATTFVSAVTTNQVTVTHVATAGMIYGVTCTNF